MKRITLAVVLAAVLATVAVAGETVSLPQPQKTDGMPLFEAIDHRASPGQSDFPFGKLSREDAATILWATTGLNRDGKDTWTVPMAMGVQPYCKVYYADTTGAYRYDWKTHSMEKVTGENIIERVMLQDFAKKVPAALIIVEDGAEKAKIRTRSMKARDEFTVLAAGMMSQNAYLAARGVGAGARLVYSVELDDAAKYLQLAKNDRALFAILLGK